jgi:hypothetical protein
MNAPRPRDTQPARMHVEPRDAICEMIGRC